MSERSLTPQEAERALKEMSDRRDQVDTALPPWTMLVPAGALLLVYGVVLDVWPQQRDWFGLALPLLCLVLIFAARTKVFGSVLGQRFVPSYRWRGSWGLRLLTVVLLAVAVGVLTLVHAQLTDHDIAAANTITFGLLGTALSALMTAVMRTAVRSSSPYRSLPTVATEPDPTEEPAPALDQALLDPTRFSIVSLLAATSWAEFGFVRDAVGLSDSALSKQAATLAKLQYVDIEKGHVAKRPRTWLQLSAGGRTALRGHVAALQDIARASSESGARNRQDERPVPGLRPGPGLSLG